jgi:hypothetical protein
MLPLVQIDEIPDLPGALGVALGSEREADCRKLLVFHLDFNVPGVSRLAVSQPSKVFNTAFYAFGFSSCKCQRPGTEQYLASQDGHCACQFCEDTRCWSVSTSLPLKLASEIMQSPSWARGLCQVWRTAWCWQRWPQDRRRTQRTILLRTSCPSAGPCGRQALMHKGTHLHVCCNTDSVHKAGFGVQLRWVQPLEPPSGEPLCSISELVTIRLINFLRLPTSGRKARLSGTLTVTAACCSSWTSQRLPTTGTT